MQQPQQTEISSTVALSVGLVVIIKERQTDLIWMFHCIQHRVACMAGAPLMVKGGMYTEQQARNPKHRLRSN